jgi:hypothetical protein
VPGDLAEYKRAGYDLMPLLKWNTLNKKGKPIGKCPKVKGWRRDEYLYRDMRSHHRNGYNIGVRLKPGQLVVDVDPRNFPEGVDSFSELCRELDIYPEDYPTVVTGSGGLHLYMRKPEDLSTVDSLQDFQGVEFKTYGRYVVSAGSIHPSGKIYSWDDFAPSLEEAPKAPRCLLKMIKRPPVRKCPGGIIDPEELTDCLEWLDVEDYEEHGDWLAIMMAAHHATGGEGRDEFIEWSTGDPKYAQDAWLIGRRWDSLHNDRDGAVTASTLYRAVIDRGGRVPGDRAEDDFEAYEGDDDEDEPAKPSRLERMNDTHAVVNERGKFRVYSKAYDPVLEREYWSKSDRFNFTQLHQFPKIEIDGKSMKPIGEWWLDHARHAHYAGTVFDPEKLHHGFLNLWTGWAVEPKRGSWSALEDLVHEVLCDENEAWANYVFDWAANMVQRPGSPAEVALVFKGEKGTGKGTWCRAINALAGRHGLQLHSAAHLTGRFNDHLRDCISLFGDEAFYAGDHDAESALKMLITEPILFYEAKGENAIPGKNLIHLQLASNKRWVVPAGLDGERRFAIFNVNTTARGDIRRWNSVNKQLYDEGGLSALLWDLMKRNIEGWHPRDNVPSTPGLVEQKLRSMDEVESFWFEILNDGCAPGALQDWNGETITVWVEDMQDAFQEACRAMNARSRRGLESALGRRLSELVPGIEKKRKRTNDEAVKSDCRGRAPCYVIPPLEACRDAFAARLGEAFKWD